MTTRDRRVYVFAPTRAEAYDHLPKLVARLGPAATRRLTILTPADIPRRLNGLDLAGVTVHLVGRATGSGIAIRELAQRGANPQPLLEDGDR